MTATSGRLPEKIHPNVFPGLNTDNLPYFVPIAAVANGRTLIHDWIYEDRALYYTEMKKIGAQVELADPHRVYIIGPTNFMAADVVCPPASAQPSVADRHVGRTRQFGAAQCLHYQPRLRRHSRTAQQPGRQDHCPARNLSCYNLVRRGCRIVVIILVFQTSDGSSILPTRTRLLMKF